MPPLTLPPNFHNSFWSQDYRSALEVLFKKLEQGCAENDEILAFVKARIQAEATLGSSLTSPAATGDEATGFSADDGASLLMAFRGLQHESRMVGEAHQEVTRDLKETVADPFEGWSYQHAKRVEANKHDLIDGWVGGYEAEVDDVERIRTQYLEKCRKADDAEDDLKFAPNKNLQQDAEKYTEQLADGLVKRASSLSERLGERLKTIGQRSREASPARHPHMPSPKNTLQMLAEPSNPVDDGASDDGTITPRVEKGKGKEVVEQTSPRTMSPAQKTQPLGIMTPSAPSVTVTTHLMLGGVSIDAAEASSLLFKAQSQMPLRNVKVTLLGEYDHCFSGEEFVIWLKTNVEGFKGSLDLAEDAARTLTEEYRALRRIGELGNKFDNSPNVFYQFRAKAFNLQAALQQSSVDDSVAISPVAGSLSESVASGFKRSNTVVSSFYKTIQNATAADNPSDPQHVKARKAAQEADIAYRKASRELDQHRCALEERIEETLKTLQRWEMDRLNAVKTVLLQYQGITASVMSPLMASNERASVLISTFMPENDVKALIERYRTGPFRPHPKLYESITHETDSSFGIDLRKWAGEGAFQPIRSIGSVDEMNADLARGDLPPVLTGLLEALRSLYNTLPSDDQRRKTWIYEVPLAPVHQLRATLNTLPFDMPVSQELFSKVDAPVLAGTVKLWLLELNPPVGTWDGWEDMRKIYRNVGGDVEEDPEKEKAHLEELKNILGKLPLIHLKVLDALVTHLKTLVETTTTQESNDIYIAKLSMSVGRGILRPRQETSMTITSNHAPRLLSDLIKHRDDIFPSVIEKKRRESAQRAVPQRKRTKPFDARQMRRSVDASADPKKYLEAQLALKTGASRPSTPSATGDRPQNFLSPPSSPPRDGTSSGDSDEARAPSPVSLNDEKAPRKDAVEIQPSSTNRSPPAATQVEEPAAPAISATLANPSAAQSSSDAAISQAQSSLHRTTSSEVNRVRGPRVLAGARPPRPLSSASSATVSSAARTGSPTRPTPSPRNSIGGGTAAPGSELRPSARPRTPPDVKDYLPSKRGGRAPAGSFSRARQPGDVQ